MSAWFNPAWHVPVLPSAALLPLWVALSWGLVGATVLWIWADRHRPAWWWRALAAVLLLSLCLPATRAWTAWLALALQSPSLLGLGWLLLWAWDVMRRPGARAPQVPVAWAFAGVVLGWGLWLDTLNLWPAALDVPLFAWGFSAVTFWAVLAWLRCCWRCSRCSRSRAGPAAICGTVCLTRGSGWVAMGSACARGSRGARCGLSAEAPAGIRARTAGLPACARRRR